MEVNDNASLRPSFCLIDRLDKVQVGGLSRLKSVTCMIEELFCYTVTGDQICSETARFVGPYDPLNH